VSLQGARWELRSGSETPRGAGEGGAGRKRASVNLSLRQDRGRSLTIVQWKIVEEIFGTALAVYIRRRHGKNGRLHVRGWTIYAKQLFWATYTKVMTYVDSHVWMLRGMWNKITGPRGSEAIALWDHSQRFRKPEDEAAVMLFQSDIYTSGRTMGHAPAMAY
jgi:hypothetical protein